MEWINVKDCPPPEKAILVYGKCGMPHIAIFDYGNHCHTEHCYIENGHHFPGSPIEFTHWIPLPEKPHGMD